MKLKDTLAAAPGAASRIAQGAGQSASLESRPPVKDKVSVSKAAESLGVEAARAVVAGSRADRVQEIVAAVRSGQYYPSPQQIAQKLVSEAEVEARLRVLLAK